MVKEKTVKVKALGNYKVVNVKKGINYNFKGGETVEIQTKDLDQLVKSKIVEEIKNG